MVHRFLSQRFFDGALAYYGVDESTFDVLHPLPGVLNDLLDEARGTFLDRKGPEQILAGLGFHVGLEFFAHQEFNLVDACLRKHYPERVAGLDGGSSDGSS